MAQTYFGSTLRTGTDSLSDTTNGGFVVVSQTTTVTTNSGAAVSATLTLPASSQIIDLIIDTMVTLVTGAQGGKATTCPLTIGTSAAGTQYLSATDVFAGGGRIALPFTDAQCLAMSAIGDNTSVVVTVDPNGTIVTTQGVFRMTVVYAQKV